MKSLDELQTEERELTARLEALRGEICSRVRAYLDNGIKLTPKQQKVLELVRQRFSNKEIGNAMGVSERAAKFHVTRLLQKFKVQTRRDLE